jgi:hypothetical protein
MLLFNIKGKMKIAFLYTRLRISRPNQNHMKQSYLGKSLYPTVGARSMQCGTQTMEAHPWPVDIQYTLRMKGRWESNRNVWFPFMYSQTWNCNFQNRIIMFCLPVPTLIYLWEIYIFPGSVCLFCCRKICGLILGINKSLTDTKMLTLWLRSRNSQKRNT